MSPHPTRGLRCRVFSFSGETIMQDLTLVGIDIAGIRFTSTARIGTARRCFARR